MNDHLIDCHIYIVDDEPHNLVLLSKLLARHGFKRVTTCQQPEKVMGELNEVTPDLLLLDLTMPGLSGLELLDLLQGQIHSTPPLPVLVLTGDTRTDTRRQALSLGAKDFVNKPFDPPEVICRIQNLLESRLLERRLLNHSQELEALTYRRTLQLRANQLDTVRRLGLAAEYRDDLTGEHIARVGRYSSALARAAGLDETYQEQIGYAAQLHDIGKIAIPDSILLKRGPLSEEERSFMQQHVRFGLDILKGSDCPILRMAEQIALYHHERWDGKGYLQGLANDAIPLSARITSVCDVYDALTCERPYKRAWTPEEARAELFRGKGAQFDPQLVDLFLELPLGNVYLNGQGATSVCSTASSR